MPRPVTGAVIVTETRRGTTYALRFSAYGKRRFVTLGSEGDGWTPERADNELKYVLGQVERNTWAPPTSPSAAPAPPAETPRFHQFATQWFAARKVEGGRYGTGLTEAGEADLAWQLQNHLLPFFVRHLGNPPLDQVTVEHVDRFRRDKVAEGRIGSTSINKCLATLSAILELAVEYDHVQRNVAKGKRRRLPAVKASRTWLERPEQIDELLRAAGAIDRSPHTKNPRTRVLFSTLTFAGLRIDEALSLTWADVNLAAATITVRRATTDAGVRTVDVLPVLVDALAEHRAAARCTSPADFVFATSTGGKDNPSNVRRLLARAVSTANEALTRRNLPALAVISEGARRGGTTPHSLRRTFASILVALGEDPSYVMEQMGHTDPSLTLAVYSRAMRQKAGEREQLRVALERLVGRAEPTTAQSLGPVLVGLREHFLPIVQAQMAAEVLAVNGSGSEITTPKVAGPRRRRNEKTPPQQAFRQDGRGGFRTCDLSRVKRALSH